MTDHNKSRKDFDKRALTTYSVDNTKIGQTIKLGSFLIKILPAYHNVECISFLITDIITNKNIYFATDTKELPNIVDKKFDCMLIECNYSKEEIIDKISKGLDVHQGYENHMSLEYLAEWLKKRTTKPKTLCLIHLSNRSNLNEIKASECLKQYADNVLIAKEQLTIEI